mmetsp:Transcript_133894/g.232355  ORF Transcript_133894/g.232355 Transcript_133894/m.232355 type:complete len:323 (-) Transcript_133894:1329-2297(-)
MILPLHFLRTCLQLCLFFRMFQVPLGFPVTSITCQLLHLHLLGSKLLLHRTKLPLQLCVGVTNIFQQVDLFFHELPLRTDLLVIALRCLPEQRGTLELSCQSHVLGLHLLELEPAPAEVLHLHVQYNLLLLHFCVLCGQVGVRRPQFLDGLLLGSCFLLEGVDGGMQDFHFLCLCRLCLRRLLQSQQGLAQLGDFFSFQGQLLLQLRLLLAHRVQTVLQGPHGILCTPDRIHGRLLAGIQLLLQCLSMDLQSGLFPPLLLQLGGCVLEASQVGLKCCHLLVQPSKSTMQLFIGPLCISQLYLHLKLVPLHPLQLCLQLLFTS